MIDKAYLLNTADKLIDADDGIQACKECIDDYVCLAHATQWNEALTQLREALQRPRVKVKTSV
jgi:hypothetical protein